jgi:hypothetical protein
MTPGSELKEPSLANSLLIYGQWLVVANAVLDKDPRVAAINLNRRPYRMKDF